MMKMRERHVTFKGNTPGENRLQNGGGIALFDGRQLALGGATERAAVAERSSPLPPIPGTNTETTDYILQHGVVSSPIRLWRAAGIKSSSSNSNNNSEETSARNGSGTTNRQLGRRGALYIKRVPSEPVIDSWAESKVCPSPQQIVAAEKVRLSSSATHREATVARRHTFQEGRSKEVLAGDCGMDGRPPGRRGRVRRTASALMRPGSILFLPEEQPPKRTNNTPTTPPPTTREPPATEAHLLTTQKLRSFRKKRLNVTPDSTTLTGAAIYNMDGGSTGLGTLKSPQISHAEPEYGRISRGTSATRTKSRITSATDLSRIHRLASLNNRPQGDTTSSLTTPTREQSSLSRNDSPVKARPTTANPKIQQDTTDAEARRSPVRRTPRPTSRDARTSRSCNRDERSDQNGQLDGQYFPKDVNAKYGRTTFITSTKPTSSYRHLKSTIKFSSTQQQQQQQQHQGSSPVQNGTGQNGSTEQSLNDRDLEIVRWLEGCDQRPRKHVAFKLGEENDGYLTEYFL